MSDKPHLPGDLKQFASLEDGLEALVLLSEMFGEAVAEIIEADRTPDHEVIKDVHGRLKITLTSQQFQMIHFMHKHMRVIATRAFADFEDLQVAVRNYRLEAKQ